MWLPPSAVPAHPSSFCSSIDAPPTDTRPFVRSCAISRPPCFWIASIPKWAPTFLSPQKPPTPCLSSLPTPHLALLSPDFSPMPLAPIAYSKRWPQHPIPPEHYSPTLYCLEQSLSLPRLLRPIFCLEPIYPFSPHHPQNSPRPEGPLASQPPRWHLNPRQLYKHPTFVEPLT